MGVDRAFVLICAKSTTTTESWRILMRIRWGEIECTKFVPDPPTASHFYARVVQALRDFLMAETYTGGLVERPRALVEVVKDKRYVEAAQRMNISQLRTQLWNRADGNPAILI